MRILLISYFFPPYNAIGAVRAGKTAKYLHRHGHEVRVLTARDQPLSPSLPLEVPAGNVVATPWINVNRLAEVAVGGRARVAERGFTPAPRRRALGAVLRAGGALYRGALNIPDGQVGWLPYALPEGARQVSAWRPDVIYASAWPVTSLIVAHRLSRRFGVPWVAELRDLWRENQQPRGRFRRAFDARAERRVLSSASALVTVSEPLAETLRGRYAVPVRVVLNGFDPDDYPARTPPDPREPLRVVYTGTFYPGKQDPAPLLAALKLLREPASVRVLLYGRYLDPLRRLAEEHGVADRVEIHDAVPYAESLRAQRDADVLLLLSWADPDYRGVYTGKIFEYLGARRPILAAGLTADVASRLIVERGAGVASCDPGRIAAALEAWLQAKRGTGIADLDLARVADLTRERQTEALESVLRGVVRPA